MNCLKMRGDFLRFCSIYSNALVEFYSVSYAWYGVLNLSICVFVGVTVSIAVNAVYKYRGSYRIQIQLILVVRKENIERSFICR